MINRANQAIATAIAEKMRECEKLHRQLYRAQGELHQLLERAARSHGPSLGLDVAPLSAGGEKPR